MNDEGGPPIPNEKAKDQTFRASNPAWSVAGLAFGHSNRAIVNATSCGLLVGRTDPPPDGPRFTRALAVLAVRLGACGTQPMQRTPRAADKS